MSKIEINTTIEREEGTNRFIKTEKVILTNPQEILDTLKILGKWKNHPDAVRALVRVADLVGPVNAVEPGCYLELNLNAIDFVTTLERRAKNSPNGGENHPVPCEITATTTENDDVAYVCVRVQTQL